MKFLGEKFLPLKIPGINTGSVEIKILTVVGRGIKSCKFTGPWGQNYQFSGPGGLKGCRPLI